MLETELAYSNTPYYYILISGADLICSSLIVYYKGILIIECNKQEALKFVNFQPPLMTDAPTFLVVHFGT